MTTRILLVDDSDTDRLLFQRLIEKDSSNEVEAVSNARAALSVIQSEPIDLVVTDMQMPEMDGLELVRAVRHQAPDIPVVLLTGKGSEELATRALNDGAASYVAKSMAGDSLLETIRHVVALSSTRVGVDSDTALSEQNDIRLSLRNDPAMIPEVVRMAQRLARRIGVTSSTGAIQIGTAVDAALKNALFRGNLDIEGSHSWEDQLAQLRARVNRVPYKNRRIDVQLSVRNDALRIVVTDNGYGFDVRENSEMGLSLSGQRGGRGLFLMGAFMDRVFFNHAGNQVTLVKNAVPLNYSMRRDEFGWLHPESGADALCLSKRRLVIGRDSSCDIMLEDDLVSSHHCILYMHDGTWFVRDMKSRSGVKINGVRKTNSRLLPGTKLAIGSQTYEVRYDLPQRPVADDLDHTLQTTPRSSQVD